MQPTYTVRSLAQATVVIDCTAEGLGLQHKREWYEHLPRPGDHRQGSEFGFGRCMRMAATMSPGIWHGSLSPSGQL